MTFSLINPLGWAINEELFSAQMNSLDTDHTFAVDKRGDTIDSAGTITFPAGSSLVAAAGANVGFDDFSSNTGTLGALFCSSIIGSNASFSGGSVTLDSATALSVAGPSLFGGTVGFSNTTTFNGSTSFNTAPFFNAGMALNAGQLAVFSGASIGCALGSTTTFFAGSTVSVQTNNFSLTGTNKVKLQSRSLSRVQPYVFQPVGLTSSPTTVYWVQDGASPERWQTAADAQTQSIGRFELVGIPHNSTLTSVQVFFEAPTGHTLFPTGMPILFLKSIPYNSNTAPTLHASDSKTAASYSNVIGNYNGVVDSMTASTSLLIDRTTRSYYVVIFGESSTNALKGWRVLGCRCTYTVTEYDDG